MISKIRLSRGISCSPLLVPVFVLLVVSLFGCRDKSRPADLPPLTACEVTVIQDGSPLVGAIVTFHNNDTGSTYKQCSATTNDAGVAILQTYGYPGVPKGSYAVSVRKLLTEGGTEQTDFTGVKSVRGASEFSLVDQEFTTSQTSPLSVTIGDAKKQIEKIDVGKSVKDFIGMTP